MRHFTLSRPMHSVQLQSEMPAPSRTQGLARIMSPTPVTSALCPSPSRRPVDGHQPSFRGPWPSTKIGLICCALAAVPPGTPGHIHIHKRGGRNDWVLGHPDVFSVQISPLELSIANPALDQGMLLCTPLRQDKIKFVSCAYTAS